MLIKCFINKSNVCPTQEEVDAGAIIVQKAVPVLPEDSEESLSERILEMEWQAYPEALQLVASGKVKYGEDDRVVWQS